MNIKDIDLNLLVIFDIIMKTRSLTVTARHLDRAQPTISHSLARLRTICNDPLFIRVGNVLEPTALAQEIAAPISSALELMERSLARSRPFDPAKYQEGFTVIMTDIGLFSLLPLLVARLRVDAPGARLTATQLPREEFGNALQQGRADILIAAFADLKGGFMQQPLFEDSYVCVTARENTAVGEDITLQDFLDVGHIGIISPGLFETELDRSILPMGRARRIIVRVPHYLAALSLLPGTDLLVTVPRRVLKVAPNRDLLREVQVPLGTPRLKIRQFWHERVHHRPAIRWLRSVIADLFKERGFTKSQTFDYSSSVSHSSGFS